MATLDRASRQLFSRPDDERFPSLEALQAFCDRQRQTSTDRWVAPSLVRPLPCDGGVALSLGTDDSYRLTHWSFSQLCTRCGVAADTLNRLTPETASRALQETMPGGTKQLQVLTTGSAVRSIHGVSYSRLWSADLLTLIRQAAVDFQPPPVGYNGATGLYAGEQDLFCFLIDPTGWAEINGQAFAPGFFAWNSEVGKCKIGVSTFWFQAVCQNHIVWDATEVTEFTRKHTGNVEESLAEIRRIVEGLAAKRDSRRDGFVRFIGKAMDTLFADDAEQAKKQLLTSGFNRALADRAVQLAHETGTRFTIFTVVDALTQIARELPNAGQRLAADEKASALLALVK